MRMPSKHFWQGFFIALASGLGSSAVLIACIVLFHR